MDMDVKRWWEAYTAEFSTGPANAQQLIAYASNRGTRLPYGVVRRYLDGLKADLVDDMPDPSSEAMLRPVPSVAVVREDSEPFSNQAVMHSAAIPSDESEPDCEDPGLPGLLQASQPVPALHELTADPWPWRPWSSETAPEPEGFDQCYNRSEVERRQLLAQVNSLPPAMLKATEWLQERLPELLRSGRRRVKVNIPVFAVRWTHKHVNASLAFRDGHGNAQENVLKLYDQLFRGRLRPHEMDPLVVKLPETAECMFGIRSRNNRRLLALRMLQSARMDECIMIPCDARSHQHYLQNSKFKAWFDKGDDGGSGWSIHSREGTSKHRNVPTFNNAAAALIGLGNLVERELSRPVPDEEKINKVREVLKMCKRRPVSAKEPDEETLTFDSRYEDAQSRKDDDWESWRKDAKDEREEWHDNSDDQEWSNRDYHSDERVGWRGHWDYKEWSNGDYYLAEKEERRDNWDYNKEWSNGDYYSHEREEWRDNANGDYSNRWRNYDTGAESSNSWKSWM